ncbi:MAG TPA: tyrosine-type recombinase/integrase [Fimbriimonas sp.]|nr:tyrosine-type recombinase/integrase [Fimbriimonas sp.]
MNSILDRLEFPRDTLLGDIRPWLESCLARNYQPSTLRFQYASFRGFSSFMARERGVRRTPDVRTEDLNAFAASLVQRGLSDATQENSLQTVKNYFAWLTKTGQIFDSPARTLVVPRKARRLQRVPSIREMECVLDGIAGSKPHDDLDRALLEIAYGAGLRLSELTSLTTESVDLAGCTVRVIGKGQKERVVPITQRAARETRGYLRRGRTTLLRGRKDELSLWIGRDGFPLRSNGVRCRIQNRAMRAKVRLCPHDIRRAFATHMLQRGMSPAILKELLGHATYSHLKEYLRYAPVELQAIHRRSHPGK